MRISLNNNIDFSARLKYPMIPRQEIKECMDKGYSHEKIGMKYGIPGYAVSRMALCYGLSKPKKTKAAEAVCNIRKEDSILLEISKKLNLTEEDLKKYLK